MFSLWVGAPNSDQDLGGLHQTLTGVWGGAPNSDGGLGVGEPNSDGSPPKKTPPSLPVTSVHSLRQICIYYGS